MNKTALFLALFALSFAFAQEGAIVEIVTTPAEAMQEKSLFSEEGEIDLQKIIAQDTTAEGYRERKERVLARIGQIDNEMNIILANETMDYDSKVAAHQKYTAYRENLVRSIEILDSNINIATASTDALKADMAKEAAAAVTKSVDSSTSSGGGLGWRGWTRILTFTAAALCGAAAVSKHKIATDSKDEFYAIKGDAPTTNKNGEYDDYYKKLEEKNKMFKDNELYRNIFGIGAGTFAIAGILTFTF